MENKKLKDSFSAGVKLKDGRFVVEVTGAKGDGSEKCKLGKEKFCYEIERADGEKAYFVQGKEMSEKGYKKYIASEKDKRYETAETFARLRRQRLGIKKESIFKRFFR